jgi:hypothetical protein
MPGLQAPASTSQPPVLLCTYSDGTNPDSVLIRYQTGVSMADFNTAKQGFNDHGEPTTDISGLGDAAYSSTVPGTTPPANTVVVLSGSVEVLITSSATATQMEALAREILPKL